MGSNRTRRSDAQEDNDPVFRTLEEEWQKRAGSTRRDTRSSSTQRGQSESVVQITREEEKSRRRNQSRKDNL